MELTDEDWMIIKEAYTIPGMTKPINITGKRCAIVTISIIHDEKVARAQLEEAKKKGEKS